MLNKGAVALCRACEVRAEACSASQNGGGAYRSPQLRMAAVDCYADLSTGKGVVLISVQT
ncbi:hypothetical protein P4S72_23545 [Vibrio sp. PP-XX7]